MIEFNTAILAGWMIFGYKAIRVCNFKDYYIVEPVFEIDLDDCDLGYWTLEISDSQCMAMAAGNGLMEINFYLDSEFVNESEYALLL